MSGSTAAILLAAGRSTRMGSCKQLLPLGESNVIGRCLETLLAGGIDEVVVVISPDGQEVADAVGDYPVRIAVNPRSDGDMASSVRAGRDALSAAASGVIVSLCDCPLVSAGTIRRLCAEHADAPDCIIVPCHREQRGHPLLFPRTVLNELAGGLILRDLVRHDPGRVRCLSLDDPGVLIDMDTPEDYHRICVSLSSEGSGGCRK